MPTGLPFLDAYREREAQMRAQPMQDLQQVGALQGILANIAAQQDAPTKSAILKAQLQEHLQKVKQSQMLQGMLGGTGGTNLTNDQLDALGGVLAATGHPGAATVMNIADKRRAAEAAQQNLGLLRGQPTGLAAGQAVPGAINAPGTELQATRALAPDEAAAVAQIAQQGGGQASPNPPALMGGGAFAPLISSESPAIAGRARQLQMLVNNPQFRGDPAKIQAEADNLTKLETAFQAQKSAVADRQAGREFLVANRSDRPEPPVQTHTDAQGQLWEKSRGGSWQLATGPDGKPLTSRVPQNPAAEQIYRDYANHPQVKEANDLEAKMKPLVDYMILFKKTGQSVNANDAALAKAYLAVTTSLGNRAYTLDQKQLSSLPNLGDRLGNMASSFFAGKDLTDQTRTEMFNYITQRYKALDTARQEQKGMALNRGTARGVTPEQLFGAGN